MPEVRLAVTTQQAHAFGMFAFNPANAKIWISVARLATSDVVTLIPMGYDHRVARIASQG